MRDLTAKPCNIIVIHLVLDFLHLLELGFCLLKIMAMIKDSKVFYPKAPWNKDQVCVLAQMCLPWPASSAGKTQKEQLMLQGYS